MFNQSGNYNVPIPPQITEWTYAPYIPEVDERLVKKCAQIKDIISKTVETPELRQRVKKVKVRWQNQEGYFVPIIDLEFYPGQDSR